jgi:hypothetical protein
VPTPTATPIPTNTPVPPTPTNTPTNTPIPPTPTTAPLPTATPTPVLFSNAFDSQSTGALVTGTGTNQFTGQSGLSHLTVQTTVASSSPNALSVSIAGGGSYYTYKQYATGYSTHDLQFKVYLGSDYVLPSGQYVILAQTLANSSNPGKVDLTLPSSGKLYLDYYDSAGTQHYLYGSTVLATQGWHTLELREVTGTGTGSLKVLLDGASIVTGTGLDVSTQPVTWFAVGDKFSPTNISIAGHLFVDDVLSNGS